MAWFYILLLWVLMSKHEAYQHARRSLIHLAIYSIRNRNYLQAKDLVKVQDSALTKLLTVRSDKAFMQVFSLNCHAFDILLRYFNEPWRNLILPTRLGKSNQGGRPRKVNSRYCLALTLVWLSCPVPSYLLCLISGLIPALVSKYLDVGLHILEIILPIIPEAKIEWPSLSEIKALAEVAKMKIGDDLPYTWGLVDGLNIAIQDPAATDLQNAYYNSWLCGCYCSSVFVFRVDGPIAWCRINCPGSWHDPRIARPLIEKELSQTIQHCLRYCIPSDRRDAILNLGRLSL